MGQQANRGPDIYRDKHEGQFQVARLPTCEKSVVDARYGPRLCSYCALLRKIQASMGLKYSAVPSEPGRAQQPQALLLGLQGRLIPRDQEDRDVLQASCISLRNRLPVLHDQSAFRLHATTP